MRHGIGKYMVSVVAAGALTVGMAAPALATTVSVAGGTWEYGTNSALVWSYFKHPPRLHRSSVIPAGGSVYRSSCASAGNWARVSAASTSKVDHAYYSFCD